MRKTAGILMLAGVLLSGPACPPGRPASWPGVDETVIEKVAQQAGRTAREPFINADQGDLLLFVFLLAGIAGGFIAGYHFRSLFPPKRRPDEGTGEESPGEENRNRDRGRHTA
jgi:cobalt/nickel transport system permease protein